MLSSQQLLGGQYSWYLSDDWIHWETPLTPHLCLTISVTFWNKQSNIHIHHTTWLTSCMEVRIWNWVSLKRFIIYAPISVTTHANNQCNTVDAFQERPCENVDPFFFTNMSSLLDYQLFIPPSSVAVWSTYKTVAFVTWSDNTLYELSYISLWYNLTKKKQITEQITTTDENCEMLTKSQGKSLHVALALRFCQTIYSIRSRMTCHALFRLTTKVLPDFSIDLMLILTIKQGKSLKLQNPHT